ncbi:hypothetical protein H9L21_15025 [Aeromicrobium senzhongii]|uniref:Uncharacterized protein n=1 Tax=Aeromicrobium senzhongii TaxID=2663859 RepID=A0ABX6ST93_9ACTN|nr:hypothetical protein [Aeromicrobium senzhongii]MTB89500.1 hypothetical protein [Aeromicrobium senzhongii]QNL94367.1 hypothetical protein H9L21_15025 [Aeromicrobium senzhongii]
MTDSNIDLEAIQTVVDRVTSWQDGATEGTVEEELQKGFSEVGIDVSDDHVTALAEAIQSRHGTVDAGDVLGR